MPAPTPRRLPGVSFAAQLQEAADALPRMDIAVVVGFAAQGPLHTPVAVESEEQFEAAFGADLLLAWDAQGGAPAFAYLGSAVRAFFRNGGRRCWVIRVPVPESFAIGAQVFLDQALQDVPADRLLAEADAVRYGGVAERTLTGLHAAIGIEEASLIAVPDAVHLGWVLPDPPAVARPELSPVPDRPEWWGHPICEATGMGPAPSPQLNRFLDSSVRVIPPPELQASQPDERGTYELTWAAVTEPSAAFMVEEAARPGFEDAAVIYAGPQRSLALYGRSPAIYYYRARTVVGENVSDWSAGVVVSLAWKGERQLREPRDTSDSTLLTVQRALLRLCAARGDLFAVLAVPAHYREAETIEHVRRLKATPEQAPALQGVRPLAYGEAHAFSYGALYHPWLVGREEMSGSLAGRGLLPGSDSLRTVPPDGAACGILARRALGRGAWVAPANERFNNVIALTPGLSRDRWPDFQEAQINAVRQEPRGFVALSADTLSDDADLRPISVRRLLILLRRLAMTLGARYVFEPNDESFHRAVALAFEDLLAQLLLRGAFAGATSAAAYQVVTDTTLNRPTELDRGRFTVELRVAPASSLNFLTVRLVQSNEHTLVVEGS